MNAHAQEVELKFATHSDGLLAVLESHLLSAESEGPVRQLISAYFDTVDQALAKQQIVLRIRRAGRALPLMGLKWRTAEADATFVRGEIEVRSPAGVPDLSLLEPQVAERLQQLIGANPLEPQFETRVRRRTRMVRSNSAEIEVAFDEGEVVAGERRAPITEIECELKSGDAGDFYEFAARLAQAHSLKLDIVSKAERGHRLIDDRSSEPVKAKLPDLPEGCSLDDAMGIILTSTLNHFLANWASLREAAPAESVHQMRVALRRMRSVLAIFHREIPSPDFAAFRAEAKRLASSLGAARECDAFGDLLKDGPVAYFEDRQIFEPLLGRLAERRERVFAEARQLIDEPQTTLFVLRLQGFLSRRGWRNALSGEQLPRLTQPARQFALAALMRLHARALKRGRHLLSLPDEDRHEVRIALKNLRYGAEFFGSLFPESDAQKPYVRSISILQDLLGAHNDAAGAEGVLTTLEARDQPDTALAAGIVMGWFARNAAVGDSELGKAWKAFRRAPVFWA